MLAGGAVFLNVYQPLVAKGSDALKLENAKLRIDGGYILEPSAAGLGGKLTAVYFNPKSMYVEFEWTL